MSDNPFANGCAWIEGEYVPMNEARIPIMDTGFIRSDVTYDVVATWEGKFFRLEDHLDRFERSWHKLRMSPPLGKDQMRDILMECVRRSGIKSAYVEMIVSRGVASQGVRDPRKIQNRFYAFAVPYIWILKPEFHAEGLHMVIAEDTARIPTRSVDPTVKNFHWGDLTRGLMEAYDRGGNCAVLLDIDGYVTEGHGFNVFAYHDGMLKTASDGVLHGITRRTAIELAEQADIPVEAGMFKPDVLHEADEIFIATTAGGIIGVTKLNDTHVGTGRVGPITSQLYDAYWTAHLNGPWTTPIDD